MRVLFVLTDSKYMYGASKSLKGLLDGLDGSFEYDMVLGKSFTQNTLNETARANFGGKMRNLYYMWVPRYRCIDYTVTGIIPELSHAVNNFMALVFRYRISNLIKQNDYDYIHLNATVLYPLIERKHKYIVHNRDIVKEKYWLKNYLKKKLSLATGIINIDSTTKNALDVLNSRFNNSILLNNPINMLNVRENDPVKSAEELGTDPDHRQTIFAMLGQINEQRGSRFVLDTFMKAASADSVMLVVGNTGTDYAKKVVKDYSSDKRIIFTGELSDVTKVYRIADCIVRGEDEFALGRTHMEGLFSGANLIIPGKPENISDIYNGLKYKDKVLFYEPRNDSELSKTIGEIKKTDWNKREYYSNVEEYSIKYKEYIFGITGRQDT